MSKENTFLENRKLVIEAEAFLGPWRPINGDEIVYPGHISETDGGIKLIPTRIYDKPTLHNFYDLQMFAADD